MCNEEIGSMTIFLDVFKYKEIKSNALSIFAILMTVPLNSIGCYFCEIETTIAYENIRRKCGTNTRNELKT